MKGLLFLLLALHGCSMQPAHADALPPGFVPRHAEGSNTPQASAPARPNRGVTLSVSDPLGYQPAPGPAPIPGGATARAIYDYPIRLAALPWSPGRGSSPSWNPPIPSGPGLGDGGGGGGGFPDPSPERKPETVVPGPLPVLGVAVAWGWARRLRRRVG